jgi:hypothetical protein
VSLESIIIGLLAIGIGLAWAFYGLKLFTILLPIWAFFFGLIAGAQWGAEVFGQGFFATVLSWGIGLVFGLVLAAISFFWYYAAVVLAAGALGYILGVGFFEWLGWGTGIIAFTVGLILGAIFAIAAFVLGVPALLIVVVSAFSGAAAAVNGVLIFLGQIKLEDVGPGGMVGSLLTNGAIGTIAWIAVAAAAILYQMRDISRTATELVIDRSAYRY